MAFLVKERTNAQYKITLKYEDGSPVPKADVSSFKVTLFNLDDDAQTILNSRGAQEQAPGFTGAITMGTIDGLVTFNLQPADNQIVAGSPSPHARYERHRLIYDVTANGKRLVHQDELLVENTETVTS